MRGFRDEMMDDSTVLVEGVKRKAAITVADRVKDPRALQEILEVLGLFGEEDSGMEDYHYELCRRQVHRMTPENRDGLKCRACASDVKLAEPVKPASQFCRNGHERTQENTRIDANGMRVCRECRRESSRKSMLKQRSTCSNGHPWTEDNTLYNAKGFRRCSICYPPSHSGRKRRKACYQGHTYEPGSYTVDYQGRRRCIECTLDKAPE